MVNNAGGNLDRQMYALPDISIDKFDEQLHLNMKTKFWGSQQAAKRMTESIRVEEIYNVPILRRIVLQIQGAAKGA